MNMLLETGFALAARNSGAATNTSSLLKVIAKLLFLATSFVALQSVAFVAKAASQCTRNNGSTHSSTIDAIKVPRDQASNTRITEWQTSPGGNARFFSCVTDGLTVGAFWFNNSMANSGTIYKEGGVNYTVWETNVKGIGIVVKVRAAYGVDAANGTQLCHPKSTTWTAWADLSKTTGNNCWVAANSSYVYYGGDAQFALIKLAAFADGSKVQVSNGWRMSAQRDIDYHWGGSNMDHTYSVTATVVNTIRCTTPDVTVVLGKHAPSEFSAVGSRTTPVKFDLEVNNCGTGLAKVSYGFNLASGVTYTAKDGLFGLKAGATAKGISVKLMKGDGTTTVELDKWITLTDYNATLGGSYKVPLSAAYQRTGDVTPGSADAELIIAMSYE